MKIEHIGNPWKGLSSYTYQDADCFYGRNQELREIAGVIKQNAFTTLYGVSGAGKTSIINAGLIPLLDKQSYLPIYIRLDHNVGHISYDAQIKNSVNKAINEVGGETEDIVGHNIDSEYDKLWLYFHSHKFWSRDNYVITPIIFIDQFEEIFTKNDNAEDIWAFFNVVDSLQYSTPTERILNTINSTDCFISFGEEQNFRMVFSMREDFLPRLEDYSYNIPALRKNRIGLKPLNGLQALDVILSPRPDIVTRNVALHIISKIIGRRVVDNELRLEATYVDTSMLSLFCTELYNYAMSDKNGLITIELVDLYGENILEWFYDRNMQILPKQTYVYLENQLLTHSGFRNSVALEDLLQHGVLQEQLDILAENRIIRIEDVNHNMRVEFTHDVLCRIAKKRKEARDNIARMKGEESALRAFTIDNVVVLIMFFLFALSVFYGGGVTGIFMIMMLLPVLSILYAFIVGRSIADCNLSKFFGAFTLACGIEVLLMLGWDILDNFVDDSFHSDKIGLGNIILSILCYIPLVFILMPFGVLLKTAFLRNMKQKYFMLLSGAFLLFQSFLIGLIPTICPESSDSHYLFLLISPSVLLMFLPVYALYKNIKEKTSKSYPLFTLFYSMSIILSCVLIVLKAKGYLSSHFIHAQNYNTNANKIPFLVAGVFIAVLSLIYLLQYSKVAKQQNFIDYYNGVLSFQVFEKYKSFKTRLFTIITCFVVLVSGVLSTIYRDVVPFITLPLASILTLHVACSEFKMTLQKSAFSPKVLVPVVLLTEIIVSSQYIIGESKTIAVYMSAIAITLISFLYLIRKERIRQRLFFAVRVFVFSLMIGFVLPLISLGYNVFNPSLSSVCRVWDGAICSDFYQRLYFMSIENEDGDIGVMDYSEIILEPCCKKVLDVTISEGIFGNTYPIRNSLIELLSVKYRYVSEKSKFSDEMFITTINHNNEMEVINALHFLRFNNKYGKTLFHNKKSEFICQDDARHVADMLFGDENVFITQSDRNNLIIKKFVSDLEMKIDGIRYLTSMSKYQYLYLYNYVDEICINCFDNSTLKPLLESVDSLQFSDIYNTSMNLDYLFKYGMSSDLETVVLDSLWDKLSRKEFETNTLRLSETMSDKAYLYLLSGNVSKAFITAQKAVNLYSIKALSTLMITLCYTNEPANISEILDSLNMKDKQIVLDKYKLYDSLREILERLNNCCIDINKEHLLNNLMSLFNSKSVRLLDGQSFDPSWDYELLEPILSSKVNDVSL